MNYEIIGYMIIHLPTKSKSKVYKYYAVAQNVLNKYNSVYAVEHKVVPVYVDKNDIK